VTPRLAALLGMAVLSGCASKPVAEEPKPPAYFQPDPARSGNVKGSVRFLGKAPAGHRVAMDAEPDCGKLHKTPVVEQLVKTGAAGALANAFVYVKTGLEGKKFAPSEAVVTIEQRGCQFLPRVVAVRTGQTVAVKNLDPVSHNIHPMPVNNRDWNQQQPPGAEDLKRRFGFAEVMIPVKCNIHAWMKSYIGVVDHPFLAVTGENGVFAFEGLPAGRYTVAAWHESLGEASGEVTVPAQGTAGLALEFAAIRKP